MLNAIRRFLTDLAPAPAGRNDPAEDERVAAAALLVHIIGIDGEIAEGERARLRELVAERFTLGAAETESLIDRAYDADHEAVDLFAFTSVLKSRLDEEGRARIIEMMWEMVFADGEVHEFEDNLVWRVAELLGVSTRERVRLKKHARARSRS